MDVFDVIFHPLFYIPFFLLLGSIAILGPIFIKSAKAKQILAGVIIASTLIFMIPYLYSLIIWILVNKLHWIQ